MTQARAVHRSGRTAWSALCAFMLLGSVSAPAHAEPPVPAEHPAPAADVVVEDEAPPPGTRSTLLLAGGAWFAAWYGLAIGESYIWKKAPAASALRIPVVGPWITVGKARCGDGEHGCSTGLTVGRAIFAGLSAVAQLGGLAIATEAAFVPSATRTPPAPKATITPLFFAGRDQITLGVSGEF